MLAELLIGLVLVFCATLMIPYRLYARFPWMQGLLLGLMVAAALTTLAGVIILVAELIV